MIHYPLTGDGETWFLDLGPRSVAVSQTDSQNRAFDLFTDSDKILIRLKVRIEVVPR